MAAVSYTDPRAQHSVVYTHRLHSSIKMHVWSMIEKFYTLKIASGYRKLLLYILTRHGPKRVLFFSQVLLDCAHHTSSSKYYSQKLGSNYES